MNLSGCLMTVTLLAGLCNGEYLPPLEGMQQLSIVCSTEQQLSFVKSFTDSRNVDFLRLTRILGESIDVLVVAEELARFKNALSERDIPFTVTVEDVQRAVRDEAVLNMMARWRRAAPEHMPFNFYPRYVEIEKYLKELAASYPDITTLEEIGQSFEGRSLYAMKISSGGKNKPIILMDAGIHAREWLAPVTALYAIHQLVTNGSNAELYENVDWHIIPSINPDGYEFTHQEYRFWRKTRSQNSGSCVGADANRNFGYKWMTVGASSDPCSDVYAGGKPFSEVETQALRDFALSHKGSIKAYLTLHTFGQYMLHPWGYTSALPDNEPELRQVGEDAVDALAAKFGTPYTVGSSTNVLYAAAGGSDDWAMAVAGAELSYTIELPGGRFDPPPTRIESVSIETFEAFKVFQKYVERKYVQSRDV